MIKIQNEVADPWALFRKEPVVAPKTLHIFRGWFLEWSWSDRSIKFEYEPYGSDFYRSYEITLFPRAPTAWRGKAFKGPTTQPYLGPWYAIGWWGRSCTDYDGNQSHFGFGPLFRLNWATPLHYLHWRGTQKEFRDRYLKRIK